MQLDKSEFLKDSVHYLGHVITPEGVRPNPDKIKAINEFPLPKTQKEIKSFLGLLGYYRRFIKDFAKITKPMTKCLKKNAKVIHGNDFLECFKICKEMFINDPILQYPDFSKEFILTTDASNYALGAVLSQGTIPNDKPVAYASRTLNETEIKYSTTEKELLSMLWATKVFRPYLYGRKFTIYTDHKSLTWLFSLKDANAKLARWRLRLEEFDFKIVYKKGKYNTNADCLSRIQLNAIEDADSITNNPGDIDFDIEDFLEKAIISLNLPPEKPKIKILSDVIVRPADRIDPPCEKPKIKILSDAIIRPADKIGPVSTVHKSYNATENAGIGIIDEIINNKSQQIIVLPQVHHIMDVSKEDYENISITKLKIP